VEEKAKEEKAKEEKAKEEKAKEEKAKEERRTTNAHHGMKLKKSSGISMQITMEKFIKKKPKDKLKHSAQKTMRSGAQNLKKTGRSLEISLMPWILTIVRASQKKKL